MCAIARRQLTLWTNNVHVVAATLFWSTRMNSKQKKAVCQCTRNFEKGTLKTNRQISWTEDCILCLATNSASQVHKLLILRSSTAAAHQRHRTPLPLTLAPTCFSRSHSFTPVQWLVLTASAVQLHPSVTAHHCYSLLRPRASAVHTASCPSDSWRS